jgi:hypothetical protein
MVKIPMPGYFFPGILVFTCDFSTSYTELYAVAHITPASSQRAGISLSTTSNMDV